MNPAIALPNVLPDYFCSPKFALKKDGKAVGTTSRMVSKDGKTLTSKMQVTSAQGEKSESVLVFDRQ